MELAASAPGKLVLLGEYAVLEGAPALVLAVDRRAHVRIAPRTDGECEVHAPDLGIVGARLSIDAEGHLHWQCDAASAAKLTLVDHVWHGLLREGLAPRAGEGFALHLDTSGFFHASESGRSKLGLGSSAALTVALATALAARAGHADVLADRTLWLRRLYRMHGGWQGGRGSGVDVAASVAGGVIEYQLAGSERVPGFMPVAWPIPGVHCRFVWSGQSVSTNDFLERLAHWRTDRHADYTSHMDHLGELAEAAMVALRGQDASTFIATTKNYASALRDFGQACGLEIYSPEQARLAELAAGAGVAYKPCGAGGDFGVVFAPDEERLATLERAMVREGMRAVPLLLDKQGADCHMRPAPYG